VPRVRPSRVFSVPFSFLGSSLDHRARALLLVGSGLVAAAVLAGCASMPAPRVPPPPVLGTGQGAAAPRAPRPTPAPEVRIATASGDVAEAGATFVRALYAADDDTAATYQPGFGELLRKQEDAFELVDLRARPMAWGEAGYDDADPTLEWTEVITRVQDRKTGDAGTIYYKIGFRRQGDALTIDLWSRRTDVR
jgi:hypothetical protein